MSNIAIIPARGGSKRLPRKNILPILGKPMLIWSCEAARDSACFDQIIVSTEDEEIANICQKAGFTVDERPLHLATDIATSTSVCLDLIERLENKGKYFESVCLLYATAPLRSAGDIRNVMHILATHETDFVHAVTSYDASPYQALYLDNQGYLQPAWPLLINKKSQELPAPIHNNGSTYAARISALKKYQSFYGPKLKGYAMPKTRSVDIDTQEDLDILLILAKHILTGENEDA